MDQTPPLAAASDDPPTRRLGADQGADAHGCPDQAVLGELALGTLSEEALSRLAGHVERCPACEQALEALDAVVDPMLARLREPSAHGEPPVPGRLLTAARSVVPGDGDCGPDSDRPRRLGAFELVELLGRGSYGAVYRARDTELDRAVAVKVLRAGRLASSEDVDRFLREARSAAQLKHPGIVLLYGTGQAEDGTCYLVEEFISGQTLEERMKALRLAPRQATELVAAVADALDYAHQQGVVHRDVKPSNIMLDQEDRPHLMDFGLAKREADEPPLTPDGEVMGTPAYMSPEQAQGATEEVDARSDIYSLGVVLYELLTGQRPFQGNRRMLLLQVIQDEPRPPSRVDDRVPRDLETICLKAMAKSPARRYTTAGDLADDLRRWLRGEPIRARRVGPAERLWRWCRRNPVAAGLLLAVTLGAGAGFWHLSRLSQDLVRQSALDSAAIHARMMEEVNAEYSSKIVEPLDRLGIDAVHDYATRPGTVPLPATFLTELGERISKDESGMQVRHYSRYPFRFRKDGGPQDDFGRESLARLERDPAQPYYQFVEDFAGQGPALRYAIARRMEASCVECHNHHPDSTKTDWRVGDVRGVLEIIRPLDRDIARTHEGLRGTFALTAVTSAVLLGLSMLVLVASRHRS